MADIDFIYNESYTASTAGLSTNANILGREQLDFGSLVYNDVLWTDSVTGEQQTRRSFTNPNSVSVYVCISAYFENGYSRVSSNDFSYYCDGTVTPYFASGSAGYDLWASLFVLLSPGARIAILAVREQNVRAGFTLSVTDSFVKPTLLATAAGAAVSAGGDLPLLPATPAPPESTRVLGCTYQASVPGGYTDPACFANATLPSGVVAGTSNQSGIRYSTLTNNGTDEYTGYFNFYAAGAYGLKYIAPDGEMTNALDDRGWSAFRLKVGGSISFGWQSISGDIVVGLFFAPWAFSRDPVVSSSVV